MTNDLINRQGAINAIKESYFMVENSCYNDGRNSGLFVAESIVSNLPSAQPERKKGEWIIDKDCEGKSRTVTCNLCGHKEFNWHDPNFCPNCGADMRGEYGKDK